MGLLLGFHLPFVAVGVCSAGSSTIPNLFDFTLFGLAAVGAKWETDGGVYYYTGNDNVFPGARNGGTWIGSCANTGYEGRWVLNSGSSPQSSEPAVNVWRAMNVGNGVRVQYSVTPVNTLIASITFELRREADQVVILTDQFNVTVTAEN